jgi:hypothetical protein
VKTAVIIDDKDHALKQILHEFPESHVEQYNFIHFDTFELFKKQRFHQIDIVFLDFFLSKDRMFGKEIIPYIKTRYLVCFSSKKKMSDAMANEAVKNQNFNFQNVFSVQKLKKTLENEPLRQILKTLVSKIANPEEIAGTLRE